MNSLCCSVSCDIHGCLRCFVKISKFPNRCRQAGKLHFWIFAYFPVLWAHETFSLLPNHCLTKLLMHSITLQTDRAIDLGLRMSMGNHGRKPKIQNFWLKLAGKFDLKLQSNDIFVINFKEEAAKTFILNPGMFMKSFLFEYFVLQCDIIT